MQLFPSLECVLKHWFAVRPEKAQAGPDEHQRSVEAKNLLMVMRRQGMDALRDHILAGARGTRVVESAALPIGAALFGEELAMETFVRRALNALTPKNRAAATYAALYYFEQEEMSCVVTERAVVQTEDPLVVLASRDVLTIWSELKRGGRCERCGATGGSLLTQRRLGSARAPGSLR